MSRALVVAVVLAVASLAYVLYPLLAYPTGRARGAAAKPTAARAVDDEEIEAAIRAYRDARIGGAAACPVCGAGPESDAVFCSTCGRRLDGPIPSS